MNFLTTLALLGCSLMFAVGQNDSAIGFYARPVNNMDVTEGSNLVFTEVMTNTGEAYSANSGFFIAPVRGLYSFSAHIQTVDEADTGVGLFRGNVQQCHMETRPASWSQSSCSVVLELNVGEEVFLRGTINGEINAGRPGSCGFAGHLIQEIA